MIFTDGTTVCAYTYDNEGNTTARFVDGTDPGNLAGELGKERGKETSPIIGAMFPKALGLFAAWRQ